MTPIEELGKLFDDFAALFETLSDVQQQKIKAVKNDDLQAVERCMQREQAIAMQLRGMQQHKDKLQAALSMENVPLRQLPASLEVEQRAMIEQPVARFSANYRMYVSAAAASRATLETALAEIDQAIARMKPENTPAPREQGNFTDIKA